MPRALQMNSSLSCIPAREAEEASHLLLLLAKAETRGPLLQHHAGDALGAWASGATHHHVDIGVTSTTDERLQKGTRGKGWLLNANPEPAAAVGYRDRGAKSPLPGGD